VTDHENTFLPNQMPSSGRATTNDAPRTELQPPASRLQLRRRSPAR
jgi:hypothetical protein